ncbi:MAG: competence/damage-inducible protein A [Pseudobdellovibrionaceae bacterium]
MTKIQLSVLGIGTELTSGQILNRNGQWISAEAKKLGFTTSLHLVTPDERPLIRKALSLAAESSDLVFVTGGLGPTTDDFTRDMIAEFVVQPLEWHEASWKHIQDRLNSRGVPIREMQKQQAYYPRGATVHFNPYGTANGFSCDFKTPQGQKKIFVLPGPPKEIEGIWNQDVLPFLKELAKNLDPIVTQAWDCIGLGESEIAAMTEKTLEGLGLEIGYRVHLPFVEVKVTYEKSQEQKLLPSLQKLSEVLGPYTAFRNGEDAAELFYRWLSGQSNQDFSVELEDTCSEGKLLQRLQKSLKYFGNGKTPIIKVTLSSSLRGQAHFQIVYKNQVRDFFIESPPHYSLFTMAEREKQYFLEIALYHLVRTLN